MHDIKMHPYNTVTLLFTFILGLLLSGMPVKSEAVLFGKSRYFDEQQLPKASPVPGGIALIAFEHKQKDGSPEVYFQGQRVMVLNTAKNAWHAVVGLSLSLATGEHHIEIKGTENTQRIAFQVHDKEYEAQYITLTNKAHVTPSTEALERIRKESAIMREAFASWRDRKIPSMKMQTPVEGPMSSSFGLKRFFNQQPRKPHSGLDIAAPTGSPITNPLAGDVIAVGDYYFNGNTVLIDHGQGLVSMYCHLDSIAVEQGQTIDTGELIGTVGSTGRVTGPHLHWSVNLNNTRVDPALFLEALPDKKQ